MKSLSVMCVSVSLASCAATGSSNIAGQLSADAVAIQYSSRLCGGGGLATVTHPERAKPMEPGPAAPGEPGTGILVQVQCKLVEMDRESAFSMLGADLCGRRTTRAIAEDVLARLEHDGDASVVSAPRLTLLDGRRGDIQVVDERAFVAAFEITRAKGSMIGDPVINVLSEGIQVEAQASTVGQKNALRLELMLHVSDLVDPIRETTVRLPGTSTSVTIQQPVCFTQTVSTSAELGPEEVLVIGSLPRKPAGRVLVALVTTCIAMPETAPGMALGTVDGVELESSQRNPR